MSTSLYRYANHRMNSYKKLSDAGGIVLSLSVFLAFTIIIIIIIIIFCAR